MTLSYSAMARPSSAITQTVPVVIPSPTASTSALPSASTSHQSGIHHLILDAGPLLSLTPLRHLASCLHTTPLVLVELRDPKARDHWEKLGLTGVDVKVEMPTAESTAKVTAFAKKTGDYAVLSQTDLSVIALTHQYEVSANGEGYLRTAPGQRIPERRPEGDDGASTVQDQESEGPVDEVEASDSLDEEEGEDVSRSIEQVLLPADPEPVLDQAFIPPPEAEAAHTADEYQVGSISNKSGMEGNGGDEVPAEDDDEGDWITPSNVSAHRNHDLGLLPTEGTGLAPATCLAAACMTGDFAVQNVLLGMGLGLVGEGGKRIGKVRSWVLRCHACFKICKDSSKRFCPSCGNPTLLRTTVTTSAKTGEQIIHLKKNFQYHLRGSKFTIPDAKPGRAKGQQKGGSGLILREDQAEWQAAVKSQERVREKEDRRAAKGALHGWNDPDWMPEIITVGVSGKGRSDGRGMPAIGHGRKNPNQARRKR